MIYIRRVHPIDGPVVEQVIRLARGEIALRQFEDWFVSETWDVEGSDLCSDITLTLCEAQPGDSEVLIVERIVSDVPVGTWTGSSNR